MRDPPNAESRQKQAPAFSMVSVAELLAEPPDETPWILENMLPSAGTSLIAGKPKAGKSTLARAMAFAIANGTPILGRNGHCPSRVLYFAHEDKRDDVREHFRKMGATNQEIYLHIGPAPLKIDEAMKSLAEQVSLFAPSIVFIDTLIRFSHLSDINDYGKVAVAMEPISTLARDAKTHISMVHHAGKGDREGADTIIGSTQFFASVDTAIILKRTGENRVVSSMQRSGVDMPPTIVVLDDETGHIGTQGDPDDMSDAQCESEILRLTENEPMTIDQIKELVGGDRRRTSACMQRLLRCRVLDRTGKGGKGDPYRYRKANLGDVSNAYGGAEPPKWTTA